MTKIISTENLYIVELQVCLQMCISDSDNLFHTIDYLLVKPLKYNLYSDHPNIKKFVDALTNIRYDFQQIGFLKGEVYIRNLAPYTTNKKYITETEVKQIKNSDRKSIRLNSSH